MNVWTGASYPASSFSIRMLLGCDALPGFRCVSWAFTHCCENVMSQRRWVVGFVVCHWALVEFLHCVGFRVPESLVEL